MEPALPNSGVATNSMLKVDAFIELLRRADEGDDEAVAMVDGIEARARRGDRGASGLLALARAQTDQAVEALDQSHQFATPRPPTSGRPMQPPPPIDPRYLQPGPGTGAPPPINANPPVDAFRGQPPDPMRQRPVAPSPAPSGDMISPFMQSFGAETGFSEADMMGTLETINSFGGRLPPGSPGRRPADTPPELPFGRPPPQPQPRPIPAPVATSAAPGETAIPATVNPLNPPGLSFDSPGGELPTTGPMGEPIGPAAAPPPTTPSAVETAMGGLEERLIRLYENPIPVDSGQDEQVARERERREIATGLIEFGLATMAASDQAGATLGGAVGQGGLYALGQRESRRSSAAATARDERRYETEQRAKYMESLLRSQDRRLGIEQRREAAAAANETRSLIANMSRSGDAGDQARINADAAKFYADIRKQIMGDDPDLLTDEERAAGEAQAQQITSSAFPGAAITETFGADRVAEIQEATALRTEIMASDISDAEKQRLIGELDATLAGG